MMREHIHIRPSKRNGLDSLYNIVYIIALCLLTLQLVPTPLNPCPSLYVQKRLVLLGGPLLCTVFNLGRVDSSFW
ncbi:hypothetical protein BJ165DRAFT_1485102 [Panaeolus papilionaceus]|nr:hypothetical protein BJ165DRAFT_1485102 [Panaeolus papilionaceus]